jgi:hypothetical protein
MLCLRIYEFATMPGPHPRVQRALNVISLFILSAIAKVRRQPSPNAISPMTRLILIALFVLNACAVGYAQVTTPDLRDFVAYTEQDKIPDLGGSGIAVYRSDGTVQFLFGFFSGISGQPNYFVPDGTTAPYFFQPIDSSHGIITAGSGPTSPSVTLTFTGPNVATSESTTGHTTYRRFSSREELLNISSRSYIGLGKSSIAGFVITGQRTRWVLIRVVGPSLKSYGVANFLPDPKLELYGPNVFGSQIPITFPPTPLRAVTVVSAFLGAFPLLADAADSVLFVRLSPGVYSVVARSATGTQEGEALTEVYIMP